MGDEGLNAFISEVKAYQADPAAFDPPTVELPPKLDLRDVKGARVAYFVDPKRRADWRELPPIFVDGEVREDVAWSAHNDPADMREAVKAGMVAMTLPEARARVAVAAAKRLAETARGADQRELAELRAYILASGVASGAQSGGILSGLGGWGGIAGMILPGLFSEGGHSHSPVSHAAVPASAFTNAPHYAQGTANTSGIPAILHDNEAVIPLSRGRKIGVELNGDSGGGGSAPIIQHMNFTVNSPNPDAFRRSEKQIAADMATAGQRAVRDIR